MASNDHNDFTIDKQEYQSVFKVFDKDNTGELHLGQFTAVVRKGGALTRNDVSDAELESVPSGRQECGRPYQLRRAGRVGVGRRPCRGEARRRG